MANGLLHYLQRLEVVETCSMHGFPLKDAQLHDSGRPDSAGTVQDFGMLRRSSISGTEHTTQVNCDKVLQ